MLYLAGPPYPCDPGWSYNDDDDSCYLILDTKLDAINAQSFCRSVGANLANIGSQEEMEYLGGQMEPGNGVYVYKREN